MLLRSHIAARLVLCLSLGLTMGSCTFLSKVRGGDGGGFDPGQIQVFPVNLKSLETVPLEDSALFIGTLEAAERVILKPETDGQVTQVLVKAGDVVTPGQPLFKLSPERSEAALTAAQARVDAARAAKNTTEAQLRSAQAQVKQFEAEVTLQNTELGRIEGLVNEGALAQQALDQVVRNRDSAIAALSAAQQQVSASVASVEEAKASLAQAEANVNSVQEDLKDTTLNAPIAGIVGSLDIKVGDYVEVGDSLTTITNNSTLEIQLPIPIEYRDRLALDLPIALRDYTTENVLAQGRINFISPTVDATTQSILVKATVPNPKGLLQDAQQVEARIIWSESPGILVPTDAIVRFGGQTFVFVAKEDGETLVAEQRPIELGTIQGNAYQIAGGLDAGEKIVVSGMLNLSDGAAIAEK